MPHSDRAIAPNSETIRTLPPEVVRAIAAGETIDSLAAAVRELVDNAIDAGATRISVALWSDRWDVRVTDNGCGMIPAALRQAARPHTTSKIQTSDDLRQVTTLGFRGEALYSLACLGQLDICSRRSRSAELSDCAVAAESAVKSAAELATELAITSAAQFAIASVGEQIWFDRTGQPLRQQPVAIAPGTIVTVRDLFGDLSSRRDALPALTQQRTWTRHTLEKIALCHPHVTWQVLWDDRPWLAIAAGTTAADILAQFGSTVRRDDLAEARDYRDPVTIEVVLGLPDRCHRRRPDWMYLAVNGRIVQQPELEQSILRATARTLPRGRYPVCFAHLHLPPDRLDWNRTPAKTEIYLRDLESLRTQLEAAVTRAYQFSDRLDAVEPNRVKTLLSVAETARPYTVVNSASTPDSAPASHPGSTLIDLSISSIAPDISRASPRPSPLPNALRATSQVSRTYIVAEHDSGLWLVEQHIAHERVLYEQLCDRWQLVNLEPPAIVDGLNARQVENLRSIGIETEAFGDTSWAVRQLPALLTDRYRGEPDAHDPTQLPDRGTLDLPSAIVELSQGDLEAAIVSTACRSAIRNGTPLTLPQMQALLNDWQRTRHPHTCPHGRPIYLSLSESSLSRFFRRHWVIGKSHGI